MLFYHRKKGFALRFLIANATAPFSIKILFNKDVVGDIVSAFGRTVSPLICLAKNLRLG